MKKVNFLLDFDDFEELSIGFLPISSTVIEHELFYTLNKINNFYFKRVADLVYEGTYYDYYHSVFVANQKSSKTLLMLIANQSYDIIQKQEITELFVDEQNVNFLLKNRLSSGYLIQTTPISDDFSLILLPEGSSSIEKLNINPSQKLYHLIETYE